ncbi:gluconate 2-dehydrogenase subunit 3 family protein [Granulicella sp. S190]|uniref:gluconate 2-dehydrogenase subunit 3 family protein n=1 Tax=Granulicella sp. S190 TaxID=1747226 RepID=UPI00131EC101|nr:gluconate 2-dehydrogenase subunit 3 family protein [Granulicella sp. S190]
MLRRDFVRAVVSVSVAPRLLLSQQTANPAPAPPPPAPVPWTLGLNPKTPIPQTEVADGITETVQRFFTPVQLAALIRLADVLMPPIGDKPGALQAETPFFLDFLIGSSPAARKKVYEGGLNWLESESEKRYGKGFAKLDDRQAGSILKPLLRTWMNDHPPTEPHADFVNIAHDDIRMATINSRAWSDVTSSHAQASSTELFWYPIDPDIYATNSDGSQAPVHVIAAPKASHVMPEYSR